jgi:hypothetical protein
MPKTPSHSAPSKDRPAPVKPRGRKAAVVAPPSPKGAAAPPPRPLDAAQLAQAIGRETIVRTLAEKRAEVSRLEELQRVAEGLEALLALMDRPATTVLAEPSSPPAAGSSKSRAVLEHIASGGDIHAPALVVALYGADDGKARNKRTAILSHLRHSGRIAPDRTRPGQWVVSGRTRKPTRAAVKAPAAPAVPGGKASPYREPLQHALAKAPEGLTVAELLPLVLATVPGATLERVRGALRKGTEAGRFVRARRGESTVYRLPPGESAPRDAGRNPCGFLPDRPGTR